MLNILKCRKEGMREKKKVRMPPQTSAQYLEASLILNAGIYAYDLGIDRTCQPDVNFKSADSHSITKHGQAGRDAHSLLTPVTI